MAYPHSQQLYADPLTAPTPSSGAYHDRPSHSPQPGYIYDQSGGVIQDHAYTSAPLGRHRSTSDSSLAPIVPTIVMGHEAEHGGAAPTGERLERRKSLAASVRSWRGRGHQDDLPPGWTKEDEEAERLFLAQGMFDWQSMKSWRFWIRKEWWYWYVAAIILAVLVALMALFHDDIVHWLEPVANWMKNLPAGYTIPAAIIFILSFPPLFGQEIVAVICGLVWGLWVGFAIVAAGTFLGEVGNFYAFKYLCRGRAEKYERDNLNYAIMAHVVRDGGFFFIFAVRMSAIPGHFSTAVFATCGMGIFIFSLACILTMPKQLIVVYLGVLFKQQEKSQKSKIISWTVLVVGGLITIWAMWYSYKKMNSVKLIVWRRQRVALAAKGVSVDPVTGARRRPTVDRLDVIPDKDEAEVLMKQTERPGSYQTPYDIRYQSTDNMSVYHVDPTKQPAGGQDITDMSHQPDHDSQAFPEARPSYPPQSSNPNLRRNQTTASRYSTHLEPHHHAEFPVPMPSGTSAAGFAIDPTSPNPILNGQAYNMAGEGPYGPGEPYHAGYGGGYDGGYAEEGRGSLMPPAYGHSDHPSHGAHGGAGGYPGGGGYPESLLPAQAR